MQPVILVAIRSFDPGYRLGGPTRSVSNLIQALTSAFKFKVVTLDRDVGASTPYRGIPLKVWTVQRGVDSIYLDARALSPWGWKRLILDIQPAAILLNSFFDRLFSMSAIFGVRLASRRGVRTAVLLAPRGEFQSGALGLKKYRKGAFIRLARLAGIYDQVSWLATNDEERRQILEIFGAHAKIMHFPNIPTIPDETPGSQPATKSSEYGKRAAFLSRIDRMKNLDIAIEAVGMSSACDGLDIYGAITDREYWLHCNERISALGLTDRIRYMGEISPSRVSETLGMYGLLLLPTKGENFGHVIAEALVSGTPVVISDRTPWNSVATANAGKVLREGASSRDYASAIDAVMLANAVDRESVRIAARAFATNFLQTATRVEANRVALTNVLGLCESKSRG